MKMYDSINAKKTALLGDILTLAQEQNKRIETEKAIERAAAAVPTSAGATTLAKSVAPVLTKEISKLSDNDAIAYIKTKAKALNIDENILRSAVLEQGVENLKTAKSLEDKPEKAPKPTEGETLTSNFAKINKILDGNTSVNGTPLKDPNGFFTPQGFKTLVTAARSSGVSRKQFLEEYGGNLDPNQIAAYGLTAAEKKIIVGDDEDE